MEHGPQDRPAPVRAMDPMVAEADRLGLLVAAVEVVAPRTRVPVVVAAEAEAVHPTVVVVAVGVVAAVERITELLAR
jgi:hypothetical protein